ncbi:hypothetical protein BACPEC_02774 [[Bacteroides] pectinophilus ATCC 43243]|uniref:Uncharacterized protein n=1 Tax=[Bacteroides] pectinophilus ATCC 43243 TaxID=483218 RepID=B7AVM6_9FIRM|nr:hypothetical protein BACPEC_02774 [[Bacteroides] pectinophilus ATCC 43243]
MKKLFSPAVRNVLMGCMAFSFWISSSHPCVLFFGEYEYPDKNSL